MKNHREMRMWRGPRYMAVWGVSTIQWAQKKKIEKRRKGKI